MRSVKLVLPNQPKPRPKPALIEEKGRKPGQMAGTRVTDLAALNKALWLCWLCKEKFDYKKHHYFRERNIQVRGKCDACGQMDHQSTLFVPESLLGQSWTPRRGRWSL